MLNKPAIGFMLQKLLTIQGTVGLMPSPCTHASRIVTVTSRNANANANTITSSKVGIKKQSCTPTPSQPSVVEHSWVKYDKPASSQMGSYHNRFHVLMDLQEDS